MTHTESTEPVLEFPENISTCLAACECRIRLNKVHGINTFPLGRDLRNKLAIGERIGFNELHLTRSWYSKAAVNFGLKKLKPVPETRRVVG
jgi:hypothetical protein